MGACFHLKRYGLTQFAKGSRLWILGAENVVLVLDNAAIHTDALVEWLWHHHKILVLFLPPRSLEWNPIEVVWRLLVRCKVGIIPVDVASNYTERQHKRKGRRRYSQRCHL
mmetsp:Transcript_5332/g.8811  ORF Transcript_5332/g.8811 Transcript_5332/m.8811 type:complete len:111 (+) Transcript_5332:260-592(+)